MRKYTDRRLYLKIITVLFTGLFIFIMISACASSKSLRVSPFFYFEHNGEKYRLRSISSEDDKNSRNELLGKDFWAVDSDQDGSIDDIVMGDISISEAQQIYNFALALLRKENKLREINPENDKFRYVNSEYTYEIKTFRSPQGQPFNQFKIISNYQPINQNPVIIIDKNADGKLDMVIRGSADIAKFQKKYDHLLQEGLRENAFIKVDDKIILKN